MKKLKVIISGGGTGGHIFPALSIANELKAQVPEADILFVGAIGKMEMERVPAAGYPIVGLPVIGLPRKLSFKLFKFVWMLNKSMFRARRIVRDFKPDVAIGVGGFASGPVLKAASKAGVTTFLQEQNSYAGKTNKWLAKRVKKICVAYPNMERYFPKDKLILTGNPVRQNLLSKVDKKEAYRFFGLDEGKPVILVLGGSLGARTLNESILANLDLLDKEGVQVIWQSGKIYHNAILERFDGKLRKNIHLYEFLSQMDMAYRAADIVISRAGAGTISEICLLGKPSVLVPSPNVAEDHQTKNAMALVENEAALMVRDNEAVEKLFTSATELLKDKSRLEHLSANSLKMAKPNATADIVNVILKELEK
ncbi:undecaprenyldiphospho-muramoylpentapeptide beta-N-acetylglucosaminyltransferase [Sunxiuqinia elliptica]|uniref:UDP-N-acetylglucosamine--N-acetylmuramyl-(pentapeptide) pyrophosphoryl-undecaprenol N-acetylglucosamine transferase n=1 Tax=Sunxiuqinia elliptica TaxID=655355 RepID=A0A4R6HAA7_9BACT|nr:undecaprenyldiphospho-muramoylpentapeptide beta-N-acetylglucosaminyltransferase [Sunxiuqinia elliptica]TDO04917.1 UDP-N-acetylglucosamine-N-acetylmuramylpentapeptide N-acetylglucosamine transferase [Sunxiuqinia elliptica]TDO64465.1 UDP-N-acetylglucosamine-N-acetylmuramylpentapeptide N-acetylglucosamine transferase [Sunxiuqinia elliptica]